MQYTTESMDVLRNRADDLADATVETMFARGDVEKFNTLMRWFSVSGQELPDGLPDEARTYLDATRTPPDWVDWDVMETARRFFLDNNANIVTALSFAAMPACYVIPHVARLLAISHGLRYPANRMAATGQFVVYLMRPDAFEEGGQFIPAAQKVRLLHASIRRDLRQEGQWDEAELGVPVCQEDMIGGQMMFSIQVLDAMHRLGVRMTEEEAAAYYYAWRVVGAILGCDQAAVPPDLEAARAYSDLYMVRHMGPSAEGVQLTKQLITLYEEVTPGTLFDPLVPALVRYLVGDTVADWLQVPRSDWDIIVKTIPAALGLVSRLQESGPWAEWLADKIGGLVTSLELTSLTKGRVMEYAIPQHLKSDFGLKSPTAQWIPPPPTLLPG
jgi:ER-bound oxygenase mpaB/B'/Rubber oxygenase, catalytic domain